MYLTTIDEIKDYGNSFTSNENLLSNTVASNEIFNLLEIHLKDDYRTLYLKVKNGNKINKADMDKLTLKLREILSEHG